MEELVFFTDLKEIAEKAKKLKQKQLIVAKRFESAKELLELKQNAKRQNLEIKFCHLLETAEEKKAAEFNGIADFFGFFGGNTQANKIGVSMKKIDFLFASAGNQRLEFDSALANNARDNNVAIVVSFSDFLNSSQRDLISLFRNYFLLAKICSNAGAKLVVFSCAKGHDEMRSSRDLESFLALLQQKTFLEDDIDED